MKKLSNRIIVAAALLAGVVAAVVTMAPCMCH